VTAYDRPPVNQPRPPPVSAYVEQVRNPFQDAFNELGQRAIAGHHCVERPRPLHTDCTS
jgi:hypothetical protein